MIAHVAEHVLLHRRRQLDQLARVLRLAGANAGVNAGAHAGGKEQQGGDAEACHDNVSILKGARQRRRPLTPPPIPIVAGRLRQWHDIQYDPDHSGRAPVTSPCARGEGQRRPCP